MEGWGGERKGERPQTCNPTWKRRGEGARRVDGTGIGSDERGASEEGRSSGREGGQASRVKGHGHTITLCRPFRMKDHIQLLPKITRN